jgi:hypothetical protein
VMRRQIGEGDFHCTRRWASLPWWALSGSS